MFIKNIFVRIINNLIKPHKLPIKIFNKLNYYLNYRKYDQSLFEKKQNDIFNHYGLNRVEGIRNLDSIKKFNINLITNKGLSSEHEIIFSSISVNKNKSINDILEIGTFDGFNALLLSNLFPNSNIDTIDLPENDEDFINFYNRKEMQMILLKIETIHYLKIKILIFFL